MGEESLRNYIRSLVKDGVVVAFSGGVDSTLVLKIAKEESDRVNGRVMACTFTTFLSPSGDIKIAKKLVDEFNVSLTEAYIDQTENEKVLINDPKRCYYCKKTIFSKALEIAENNNMKYVIDGTNLSDLGVYRPGLEALRELNIISPLAVLKFEKKDVRSLAEKLNISVSKRPSKPCLATRFPYKKVLPVDKFNMVEKGEEILSDYGFKVNRIRLYDDVTRIEIPKEDFINFINMREDIIKDLKAIGFKYINLDMEGFRSGSMDEVLNGWQKVFRRY